MQTQVAFIQERGDFGNAMIVALVVTETANGMVELVSKHGLGLDVVGKQVFNSCLPDGQRLSVHSVPRLRELGGMNVDVARFYSLNGLRHKGMAVHELEKAQGIVNHFPNRHIRFYSTLKEQKC